jgi:membrane-bound metal-dependent hydrolase YbcI (DUF457 family)
MPFTPFHLGPAAAFKALGGRYFSFMVFGFSQILMDIEALVRIYRGDSIIHGFTHTFLGATLIGIACIVMGKPVCEYSLQLWNNMVNAKGNHRFRMRPRFSWPATVLGAMIGVYSHVFLDGIMHADMHPWAPFAEANPFLDAISVGNLHLLCLGLGGFGVVLLVAFVQKKVTFKAET